MEKNVTKKRRGRPAKEILPFDEMKDKVIEKYLIGERLTYEEIGYAWAENDKKIMSANEVRRIEQSALAKIKKALSDLGIHSFADCMEILGSNEDNFETGTL